jgi:hypothetical protein
VVGFGHLNDNEEIYAMSYVPDAKRYDGAQFRRCGQSGTVLPPVSLGLWQNFGGVDAFETGHARYSSGNSVPKKEIPAKTKPKLITN